MKILISACLLGIPCRYDGKAKPQPWAEALAARHDLVPVCPEQLGGLPTPRAPSERRGDRVVMNTGADVTEQYRRGRGGRAAAVPPDGLRGGDFEGAKPLLWLRRNL